MADLVGYTVFGLCAYFAIAIPVAIILGRIIRYGSLDAPDRAIVPPRSWPQREAPAFRWVPPADIATSRAAEPRMARDAADARASEHRPEIAGAR